MTELAPETEQKVAQADSNLDGVTSPALARDVLEQLGSETGVERNALVASATQYLTQRGELPEIMLIPEESTALQSLLTEGNFNKNEDLKHAAETGELPDGTMLTFSEQVAANALYTNFDDIEHAVGQKYNDGAISLEGDLTDHSDGDHTMRGEMGEDRQGLNSLVTMLGDGKGNLDTAKFYGMFGTDTPTRSQIEAFKNDPNGYGALSPSDKQGVDFLIDRFGDMNGRNGATIDESQVWDFAGRHGISYSASHEQLTAQAEAFNADNAAPPAPVKDLTAEQVDDLISKLAEPNSGATVFATLDGMDKKADGLVSADALTGLVLPGTEGEAAKLLADHIHQFDDNGDGRIFLTELAAGSKSYTDANLKTNEDVIAMAQDKQAEKDRAEEADVLGDLKDDTKAAVATFVNDDGSINKDTWRELLCPERSDDNEHLDVTRENLLQAIGSDKYDTLTPSQQRGITALLDHFSDYSNAKGDDESIGPDEFFEAYHNKAFGIDWKEDKAKITDDQLSFNAKNSTEPDSEVLKDLRAKADDVDPDYLSGKFNDQKDMSSSELNGLIGTLPEGDARRNLMEYMAKHHDQLAGDDGYLSQDDMDAFVKAGPKPSDTKDEADNSDSVSPSLWWGGEDEYKFGAIMNPDNPNAGMAELAAMNHMTPEELHECFNQLDGGGIVIPRYVYEQYYHQPFDDEAQAA